MEKSPHLDSRQFIIMSKLINLVEAAGFPGESWNATFVQPDLVIAPSKTYAIDFLPPAERVEEFYTFLGSLATENCTLPHRYRLQGTGEDIIAALDGFVKKKTVSAPPQKQDFSQTTSWGTGVKSSKPGERGV